MTNDRANNRLMKKENTIGFRVSLYDCTNPQEFWEKIKPDNCIASIWIPQTIGDQIWMWFEFINKTERDNFISTIKPLEIHGEWTEVINGKFIDKKGTSTVNPKDWFMHEEEIFTQEFINHWTK